jgi:hypothetical protein
VHNRVRVREVDVSPCVRLANICHPNPFYPLREVHSVTRIHGCDGVPSTQKMINKMPANKTGGTCDKYPAHLARQHDEGSLRSKLYRKEAEVNSIGCIGSKWD